MGWSIGYDENWKRDIGYGVPGFCDHPNCEEEIDRGLAYVCGGEPYGGEHGCGLFFCSKHLSMSLRRPQRCARCKANRKPFTPTPDVPAWLRWKLRDASWKQWRKEHPEEVKKLKAQLNPKKGETHAKDSRTDRPE
jgi:hypothetical protein